MIPCSLSRPKLRFHLLREVIISSRFQLFQNNPPDSCSFLHWMIPCSLSRPKLRFHLRREVIISSRFLLCSKETARHLFFFGLDDSMLSQPPKALLLLAAWGYSIIRFWIIKCEANQVRFYFGTMIQCSLSRRKLCFRLRREVIITHFLLVVNTFNGWTDTPVTR